MIKTDTELELTPPPALPSKGKKERKSTRSSTEVKKGISSFFAFDEIKLPTFFTPRNEEFAILSIAFVLSLLDRKLFDLDSVLLQYRTIIVLLLIIIYCLSKRIAHLTKVAEGSVILLLGYLLSQL